LAFLAVAALCCFLLGFTSSWGPIFSIVMGEMFPNQLRGGATSIASGADFFVNFLVVLLFPYLIAWSPAGTYWSYCGSGVVTLLSLSLFPYLLAWSPARPYWIYCGLGVLAVLFTLRFLHETSGRELEEMEEVAR